MKSQLSKSENPSDVQKQSARKILLYSKIVCFCGRIGILFRFSKFVERVGHPVHPAPPCGAVGGVLYCMVELITLMVIIAVSIAQKPPESSAKKVTPDTGTTVVSSVEGTSTSKE